MANKPFMRGKDSLLSLFVEDQKVTIRVKSWDLSRSAVKAADGVCGEDRDRLDSVTNHYDLSTQVYTEDLSVVMKLLDDQANKDANAVPLSKSIALSMRPNDGSRVNFIGDEAELDDWKLSVGSRTDAITTHLPIRFRYFKKGPDL